MSLDDYRLLTQLGAGRDGVLYRALEREGGCAVELRVLEAARGESARWSSLTKRLAVAARLAHPRVRRVREIALEANPPYLVLGLDERATLAESLSGGGRLPSWDALRLAGSVAGALASAHRLGLAHGRLDPWAVLGNEAESLALDFTGLETAATRPPEEHRRWFRAPEVEEQSAGDARADVYSAGAILVRLLSGETPDPPAAVPVSGSRRLHELVAAMLSVDPDARPSAWEVEQTLDAIVRESGLLESTEVGCDTDGPSIRTDATTELGSTVEDTIEFSLPPSSAPRLSMRLAGSSAPGQSLVAESAPPERLGRFRLVEKLGEGGMGEVYKAEDEADGSLAAIKVLRPDVASRPQALERFRKEARLLAQVRNPYVTNLLEVNEDQGVHYLVLEFVAGRSLDRELAARGRLEEPLALAIAADVARGLTDAHRLGIVHRDIKPANILIVGSLPARQSPRVSGTSTLLKPLVPAIGVKLSDFGLARHAVEAESQAITQSGVLVGTPTYMAPEQCSGKAIDARTDVYSLGATLYHLVAGAPPFSAADWRGVISMHLNEPPPALRKLNPALSEGFCRVVERTLAKAPDARYADAAALLVDLERLLRGEPTGLPMHPVLPDCDPREVMRFDFEWELEASPRQLWPHVSNTDRLDRAIGFGAVRYSLEFDPARGVRRFLEGRKAGMPEVGEEHPYEWVEGRRLGILREYTQGPFQWVVSIVELTPRHGGGTTLAHRLRLVPRGRMIRFGAGWGIGNRLKRDLQRVYHRIDAAATGKLGRGPGADPFEPPPQLAEQQERRLEELLLLLLERGIAPNVVDRLGEFLATAPEQELARIRPIALARRLGLPEESVIAACLHGASVGLLVLLWDLLCPVCRIPSEVKETLRALAEHGHCPACNLDFELDFANSVELIFRAHPQVRDPDVNTYCAAGPAHSPHVVAQVRVRCGERFELELDLSAGTYRLCGPQLGWSFEFEVRTGAVTRRWDLSLLAGPVTGLSPMLGSGGQLLALQNDSERELLVRVERTASRDDALTAARASSLAVFRELFPAEVLAPGRLVSIANVTLLVTTLDPHRNLYEELGDARAFAVLHEQFRLISAAIQRGDGAVVKTLGDGVLSAFNTPLAAVRAALALPAALAEGELTGGLQLRAAAHRGPSMAATLNDQLDYFGTTVQQVFQAVELSRVGKLVLSRSVSSDPAVAAHLGALGLVSTLIDSNHRGLPPGPLVELPLAP
jgi:serine/threonine protein kinase/class 3 adenylate cyclase